MKQLLLLVVLVVLGFGAYSYFVDSSLLEKYAPGVAALISRSPKEAVAAGLVAAETMERSPVVASPAKASVSASAPAAASAPASPSSVVPPVSAPASTSSSLPPSSVGSTASTTSAPAPAGPSTIKLKNGKVIVGKVIITDPDMTWIRTEDGKTQEVKTKDILSGLPLRR